MIPDNSHSSADPMDPARARALQATLGEDPVIATGDPLPPFAHHVYFWDPQPPAQLGRDGHPATGGFIPDLGLPRRMWAAGRLVFHRPLLAGVRAERLTRIEGITRKDGRSGPLAFVRLRHDIRQRQALALTEWQDLVYRPDRGDAADAAPPPAPTDETLSDPLVADATLLFRYSALTFNGHRIHHDADYARQVEGYAGPVVHGPLLAHLMMRLATRAQGTLRQFDYRATAPLILGEPATVCWRDDGATWVRAEGGRLCMSGQAG
ncbi:3-methylfumaryl-CoA hydratase [Loktanella fryxellensis]|uniref:3-methylfumaryl-CoA hydratase n=1 Tax=Loktanella fryxellensis TaxID=245187 RepID=A0A1H8AXQ9_9RHOB|nr:acyl dehydratase [Loktanella fryxellensis]SEM75561.1 3-methylfumaryl-CoA hydratase [Loktanella fryxellensis]